MALARIDHNMAWDEWKKNTLAMHAEQYPEVWYGTWSGPDTYNSELSSYPGQTGFDDSLLSDISEEDDIRKLTRGLNWTDFPVLNLHPHAWPLYNIIHLIGAEFTKEGLKLTPVLPKEEYQFSSPILGFEKSKTGYSGWYAPKVEGNWKITLELTQKEIQEFKFLEINDKEDTPIKIDNKIIFEGKSSPNSPLKWKLTKDSY
ncbi:unnamed protein product [marine sediment metagenome]|uniref:Uncharacterized protein n=1 Tax=marine sediment metagenome TaxID=412755 RepID=X0ZNZ6_9ZZZZ